MVDFTPLIPPVFGFLGTVVGFIIMLVVWIFIPLGGWAVVLLLCTTAIGFAVGICLALN